MDDGDPDLIAELDDFLHRAPGSAAQAEEVGPFTLFRPRSPETYYARPRPGATAPTALDLVRLSDRCRDLGLPLTLSWVLATAPDLARLAETHGLRTRSFPLLSQRLAGAPVDQDGPTAGSASAAAAGASTAAAPGSEGSTVMVIGAGSPLLAPALATMSVAFGTMTGEVDVSGLEEQHTMVRLFDEARIAATTERVESGLCVLAVALDGAGEVVACGQYQPVDAVAELLALATLPTHRRRGLGAAVIDVLLDHARAHGIGLVLLTAESDRAAGLYERAGFVKVGLVGRSVA